MSLLKTGRPVSRKEKALESVKILDEETIRMNINIDKSFYKEIKQLALNEDKTIKDIVISALHKYVNKES
ncbi:MAG: hypothetical protein K2Q14_02135 [Gammaproteobacteria bacterium]|nr:hypothetical protein [Gammaproteobacteria bacterium]